MAYTVVSGDTGETIAQNLGINFSQLSGANPGVNWNNLQIDQVLNTPGGGSSGGGGTTNYNVVSGDTGEKIAQKFGISLSQLQNANPGVNWNNLQISQTLKIPNAGSIPPPPEAPSPPGNPPRVDQRYHYYSGPASNFPNPSTWQTFDTLRNRNAQYMRYGMRNSGQEIAWIQQGINQVSRDSNPHIDNRVILCIIMQESSGDVRVITTNNGVRNPGLMQSHNGAEFDPNNALGSIVQMIRDGTQGTSFGDGYTQLLKQYGNIYEAMRGYNSGSVDKSNLSNGLGSTPDYVSGIANRLLAAQGF